MREDQDEGVHVRVDVAEHAHDARTIEPDGLRAPGGVAAEVEAPRLREREDVVVRAVVVGEVDRRAHRHRQQVRDERLVPLVHRHATAVAVFERALRRRLEVHDRAPPFDTSRTGPSPRSPADGRRSVSEAAAAARRGREWSRPASAPARARQRRQQGHAGRRRWPTERARSEPQRHLQRGQRRRPHPPRVRSLCCTLPRTIRLRVADHATPASTRVTGASQGNVW